MRGMVELSAALVPLCVFSAAAAPINVGILKFGEKPNYADGICAALAQQPREYAPEVIQDAAPELLAKYQALIWPQMPLGVVKETPAYQAYERWFPIVKHWVENGGGLMVTHDAVGYKSHAPMFPEIAKGVYHDVISRDPFTAELVVSRARPFTPSLRRGDRVPLSYFDYVVSEPGPAGRILARGVEKTGDSAKSSGAVVVYGPAGKGRYIANGSLPGLLADGSVVPPSGAEKMLLMDCVRYLAGLLDDPAPASEDIGAEYDLGGKQANLLFNGGFEKIDSNGKPPEITIHNAGTMLPDFALSTNDCHAGQYCGRLAVGEFRSAKKGVGKGTVGVIFSDALHGAYGVEGQVIPAAGNEYEFSVWIRGDAGNARQPDVRVLVYVWNLDETGGKLKRETFVPKNETITAGTAWQKHTVRFFLEGYTRMAPMVSMTGTETNIPRKTLTGALRAPTDLPAGTAIYLDDAVLMCLGRVDHSGLSVEQVRALGEKHVKADWQDVKGLAVPSLDKVMLGDSVEAPAAYLELADYKPWPGNWKITDLAGAWKIRKLPGTENNPADDEGTQKEFWRPDFDDSAWPERSVPGTWITEEKLLPPLAQEYVYDSRLKGQNFYGVGWYRTRFDLPEKSSDKRLFLHFDRVHYEAAVWLNGVKLGVDRAGNSPFEFDVTDAVRTGQNSLAVRVWRSGEREKYIISDRNYGGIIGDVLLIERPEIYARALLIDPKLARSEIEVRAELANLSVRPQTADLKVELVPYGGNRAILEALGFSPPDASAPQTADGGRHELAPGTNAISLKISMERPVPWSPACPFLYELVLSANGREAGRERFGYREVGTQSNRYLLNGKGFYPKGIIFDMPSPAPGIWRNHANLLRRVLAAHKMWGVNMIFIQGEQIFAPRNLYDICDELGILINEWQGATAQKLIKTSVLFDDDNTARRIRYIYNHPSFAVYTIGNESRQKEFIEPINHVYDLVKQIDGQQRPVCAVSGGAPQVLRFKEDVVDIHAYPGSIYGHPLDMREIFENANREVWAAHGQMLPVGNWEMGGAKISMVGSEYAKGRQLFSAPALDKEALIQHITQADPGYHMPLGFRWAMLYGLRRHFVEAPAKLASDPEFDVLRRDNPGDLARRESFWAAKYYVEWAAKNVLEECRRLGELMRGGFGINMGRFYALFYLRDQDGKISVKSGLPWFEIWNLPGGSLAASELYSTYKRAFKDEFICADVFARNCFAGRPLALTVYAVNDTQADAEGWQARVVILDQDGKAVADKISPAGKVKAMTRNLLPFEMKIPADWPTGFYDVQMYLMRNSGGSASTPAVISDNHYEFFVMNARDLQDKLDAGGRRVALFDVSNQKITTGGILEGLGVKFERIETFDRLADYDVLIIGAESHDGAVVAAGEKINEWLKQGGRLLQFEQYFPNTLSWLPQMSIIKRLGGNVGSIIAPDHPVFAGINASANWDTWNGRLERTSRGGKQGGIFSALISPINKTALALGCQDTPRATDAAVQMLVSDVKVGQGQALVSQAAATFRYDSDSVATKFIQNCIKYILSDETGFAEPLSGLNILNVDSRRCGYIDLAAVAKQRVEVDQSWLDALRQGLKSCGGLRFMLADPRAALLTGGMEFKLPDAMQYMDPEWEAQKQATDHDQGALLKNRVDTLFIMAALPGPAPDGAPAARLKLVFQDGAEEVRELIVGRDIAPVGRNSDLENAKYIGHGFYVTQWPSPRSDATVVKLTVEPLAEGGLLLGGITATLAREKVHGL